MDMAQKIKKNYFLDYILFLSDEFFNSYMKELFLNEQIKILYEELFNFRPTTISKINLKYIFVFETDNFDKKQKLIKLRNLIKNNIKKNIFNRFLKKGEVYEKNNNIYLPINNGCIFMIEF